MGIQDVGIGLAFLAGLASFLSPCVLSLVPAYVGYLSGRTAGGHVRGWWTTFFHGVAFVLGFSFVFIAAGVATTALGRLLYDAREFLALNGGVVVIIFGLHMIGVLRVPILEYDTRRQELPNQKLGYLSSALMGVFFSAGWAPCTGPVLGAILTISFMGGSAALSVMLLAAYSAGLAIPFLLAAVGIGWVSNLLTRYARVMRIVEIVMGLILVVVGELLLLGKLQSLGGLGLFVDFGL